MLSSPVFALELNSSGLTSKDDPNRVTLHSYTVDIDDDHPVLILDLDKLITKEPTNSLKYQLFISDCKVKFLESV